MNSKDPAQVGVRSGRLIEIPVFGPVREVLNAPLEYPWLNRITVGEGNMFEIVRPRGFEAFNAELASGRLVLLVDEEGMLKRLAPNVRASFLYGTQDHGQTIFGPAFVMFEDFRLIEEDGESFHDWDLMDLPETCTLGTIADLILDAAVSNR